MNTKKQSNTDLEEMFASRISKEEMIEKVNSKYSHFKQSIQIALSEKEPECWRAAWILTHCAKRNDLRLIEFIDILIEAIPNKKDGHQRELIKLIVKVKLSDDQEGKLFDHCITIWESIKKSSSVRYFAFNFIYETVRKYPELKNEISFLIQDEFVSTLSPGVRAGVMKKINRLECRPS